MLVCSSWIRVAVCSYEGGLSRFSIVGGIYDRSPSRSPTGWIYCGRTISSSCGRPDGRLLPCLTNDWDAEVFWFIPLGWDVAYGLCWGRSFFVLSGFVIFIAAQAGEYSGVGGAVRFFRRRFVRIIPIMWVAIVAYFLAKFLGRGEFDVMQLAGSLFLLPGVDLVPNVLWTLRHELFFYTVFGLSIKFGFRPLGFVLVVVVGLVLLGASWGSWGNGESLLFFVFGGINIFFAIGVVAAEAHIGLREIKIGGGSFHLLLLMSGVAGIYCLLYRFGYDRQDPKSLLLMATGLGFIVGLGALLSRSSFGVVGGCLYFLGDASYSIYLFHQMFLSALLGLAAKFLSGLPVEWVFLLVVPSSVALASAVHVTVERPLLAWLRRRL